MVAGTGRFCTEIMEAGPDVFVKTGAEGVFCAAFPQRGLGVALKIDDGATRASEAVMAAIVLALAPSEGPETAKRWARQALVNWAGETVGEIHVASAMADALSAV